MYSSSIYSAILGLSSKWRISNVVVDESIDRLEIEVRAGSDAAFACPSCGGPVARAGECEQRWAHKNLLYLQLCVTAIIPLVSCDRCGVSRLRLPWEQPESDFLAIADEGAEQDTRPEG